MTRGNWKILVTWGNIQIFYDVCPKISSNDCLGSIEFGLIFLFFKIGQNPVVIAQFICVCTCVPNFRMKFQYLLWNSSALRNWFENPRWPPQRPNFHKKSTNSCFVHPIYLWTSFTITWKWLEVIRLENFSGSVRLPLNMQKSNQGP